MREYLTILRLNVCFLAILAFLAGTLILKIDIPSAFLPFLCSILAIFFICSFGNVINDYFDREIDKINRPSRPIPAGKIKEKVALGYAIVLACLGIFFSTLVTLPFLLFACLNTLIAFLYSWKFKRTIFGNLLDSYLASACFIAPYFSFSLPSLNPSLALLGLIAFFGNYSREVFKDIEDMEGDRKMGASTLPITFGKNFSLLYARILLSIGLFLSFLPLFLSLTSFLFVLGLIPGAFLSLSALKELSPSKAQKKLKLAMYLILAGFILGSF